MKKAIVITALLFCGFAGYSQSAQQCTATAKSSGMQCKNKTNDSSGLCHIHNPNKSTAGTSVPSQQCSGTTKAGAQCRNRTTSPSGRCHLHN